MNSHRPWPRLRPSGTIKNFADSGNTYEKKAQRAANAVRWASLRAKLPIVP